MSEYLTDERLMAIFNQFDIDNTGFISKQNMKQAFSKYGREIKDSDINEILVKHDIAGDKAISFDEFKKMLFDMWANQKNILVNLRCIKGQKRNKV